MNAEPSSHFAASVFGWFMRKGRWVVPERFTTASVFGGGEIDLRDARFTSQETRIHAFAGWGYQQIIVPDDIEVVVKGIGLFGGFDKSATRTNPGAPRVIITGLAAFGGIKTKTEPPL